MRVLGVDPSIRRAGWGVIEAKDRQSRALGWGEIPIASKVPQSKALLEQYQQLQQIIHKFKPDAFAIEAIIYVQNTRTAISMGSARAIACLLAAEQGLPLFEYPPARVKQAVSGRGQAPKQQVAFMVRALLKLESTPKADAADALAVALTHIQAENGVQAGLSERRQL